MYISEQTTSIMVTKRWNLVSVVQGPSTHRRTSILFPALPIHLILSTFQISKYLRLSTLVFPPPPPHDHLRLNSHV